MQANITGENFEHDFEFWFSKLHHCCSLWCSTVFFNTEDLMSGSRKLWMIPRLFSDTRAGSVWRQCQVGHILWAKKSSHHRRYHNITITVILDDLKIALETVSSFSNPPPPPMMKTTYLQVFSSDRDVPAWSRFSPGRLWWTNCQIAILGPL